MRSLDLRGVKPGKRVFPHSDPAGIRPTDLVPRPFTADGLRRVRVADITRSEFAYVAFVTGVFSRKIVAFNVAATLEADILPLDALDMAALTVGGDLTGLDTSLGPLIELHVTRLHGSDRRTWPDPVDRNGR